MLSQASIHDSVQRPQSQGPKELAELSFLTKDIYRHVSPVLLRPHLIGQIIIFKLEVLGMAEQGAQDSKQLDDIVVIVAAEVVARIGDPPAHPVLGVADRRLQLVAKVFVPG